jgi:hypothetical protein
MITRFRPALKAALASVALGALVPLAACNQADRAQTSAPQRLPDLPATMPLALGDARPVAYAPPVRELPKVHRLAAARVSNPNDYYAWADDAWGYYDALDYAPPDYGFYYDDVEPWAWQGYDDSLMFVEPLLSGFRYYFYRPGDEYPYFVRDPEWAYGYDDGRLAIVYDAYGNVIPYDDWYDGPYIDYASRYYDRGYRLYEASFQRQPVFATTWYQVQPVYSVASMDWTQDLWQQPQWLSYHERTFAPRERYWDPERERRQAETVRYAAWQDSGFQSLPPPRAIPRSWKRADWARDQQRFVPPVSGFDGNLKDQQRAAERERQQIASLMRRPSKQDQVRLAALRDRTRTAPAIDTARVERMNQLRHQFESRQVQLASRGDSGSQRERAMLERQQQRLDRAQQQLLRQQAADVRGHRNGGPDRFANTDQLQMRQQAREQRMGQAELRRQNQQARFEMQQRGQEQLQQRAQADQRRQAQAEARQQREAQLRGQAAAQRDQARQAGEQRRAGQEQARQAQQRFEQQRAAREQARQAGEQRHAAQQQMRQAAEQRRAAQEQARQVSQQRFEQQRQAREQARQAGEQQRAAREQARQAAQQQRAAQDQARQAAQQQRAAQDQARQAAQQQRAAQEQTRQAAQQQRRQQQEQVAQANSGQSSDANPGKGHGRGPH